ncbi:MAG: Rho termination factor N-terminal domain-containing protein [Solirubrobacterales bacterium]
MSAVLDIDNLLESPLADLHALAGELEIEGYRTLRKPDLAIAILESRGAIGDEIRPAVEAKAEALAAIKAERERQLAEQERLEDEAREAAATERAARESRPRSGERSGRGQRGGNGRGGRSRGGRDRKSTERQPSERTARNRGAKSDRVDSADSKSGSAKSEEGRGRGRKDQRQTGSPEEKTPISGVFEPGSGGGGRLRTDMSRRVRADADVPRGEVRRWSLKRGDLIECQAKKAKRGRTDFVVASIDRVNGQDAEQRKQKKPKFDDIAAEPLGERFAKRLFKHAPVHAGSRTVVTGPTRAAATEMLFALADQLAGSSVVTSIVVIAPRPEQTESAPTKFDVIAAKPGKPVEDILPALELVLERDRRLAEAGHNTALLIDGLDLLAPEKASEIFASARNLASAGSLTIACSAGAGSPLEAQATSIGFVAGGRKLKLDKKSSWSL